MLWEGWFGGYRELDFRCVKFERPLIVLESLRDKCRLKISVWGHSYSLSLDILVTKSTEFSSSAQ